MSDSPPPPSVEKKEEDIEQIDIPIGSERLVDWDPDAGKSEEERADIDKKLLWKLDKKLMPWLCLLYLASFLDRTNIGNAKIENLVDDLHMTPGQYNATLSIFFVSYALFEPISNILLKRLRPSVYIPFIMLMWGLCMTFMGFVKNFSGMMAARWWLGLFEAGLFPGVNYYLSSWYKRREFGIRAAIFFSFAAVAGSFGGLLAAAIAKMDGIGGLNGWAWIFVLEGIATTILGGMSFWFVENFPDDSYFLDDEDRQRVRRRLLDDKQASAEHEDFKMKYLWQSIFDWKIYVGGLIYMGVDGSLYAFSLFLPSIIKELGYESTKAQLLSVPPYFCAAIWTIFIGWAADKTGRRGIFNIGVSLIGVVGFSILLASNSPGLSYAATFLAALGIYPGIPNTVSWMANNVEGVYTRGVSLGFVVGWGNLNGVMSSNVYQQADAPNYRTGHKVILCYEAIGFFGGSVLNVLLLARENRKRAQGKRDHWIEGKTEKEVHEDLGDRRPDFRYTL